MTKMWETVESEALAFAATLLAPAEVVEIEAGVHSFANQCAQLKDGLIFVTTSSVTSCEVYAENSIEFQCASPAEVLAGAKDRSLNLVYSRHILSTLDIVQLRQVLSICREKLCSNSRLYMGFLSQDSNIEGYEAAGKALSERFALLGEKQRCTTGIFEPVRLWGKAELENFFTEAGFSVFEIVESGDKESFAVLVRL